MLKQAISLLFDTAAAGALRRASFSRPENGDGSRVTLRACTHKGEALIATEKSTADGKVYHKNLSLESAEEALYTLAAPYMQININTALGDAEYKRSAKGKEIIIGGDKLKRALKTEAPSFADALTESLDRKKNYILSGNEPFLCALGISDARGRVHDKKQAKFRQINRFLEHIRDIESALPKDGTLLIYDLCCGSGCIGLTVAKLFPNIKVICIDLSDKAIEYTTTNKELLGADNVTIIKADVLDSVGFLGLPRPDIILSNPPYIKTEEIKTLQPEIAFEPFMALDGGDDGLVFYRALSEGWFTYINKGGYIAMEIGEDQGKDVLSLFVNKAEKARVIKDASGLDRVVAVKR